METLRMRLESASINLNYAGNHDENWELTSTRDEPASEENILHGELELRLPTPPSGSPDAEDRGDCEPVSTDNVDSITSSLSERDIYTWNSASVDLPSLLTLYGDGNERLIWPLEEEFSVSNGFGENTHYSLSTCLGEGGFGACYLAVVISDPSDERDEGRVFCVKKCQYRYNELLALILARRENIMEIIQFYGAKLKGIDACIFMEFMAGRTIAELIREEKKRKVTGEKRRPVIAETDSFGFLEDVLKALKFLHMKGIVHRDVKGDNVLLTEGFLHAKLADFGSAESRNEANPYNDIWKTGCLSLEMWNGERSPLFSISATSLQRQNSCNPEDHIPSGAMQETKDLLRICFGLNTTDQNCLPPSAAEVLEKSNAFPVKEFLKQLSETSKTDESREKK